MGGQQNVEEDRKPSREALQQTASNAAGSEDDEDATTSSRAVTARCRKCRRDIGEFYNSFVKVTNSYALPKMLGSYRIDGLQATEKVKPASEQSELSGCDVAPLDCLCRDTLGLKCVRAPKSKAYYADREFFKLTKIDLLSESSGDAVAPVFQSDGGRKGRTTSTTTAMVSAPEVEPVEARQTMPAPILPKLAQALHPVDAPHDAAPRCSTLPEPQPHKTLAETKDASQYISRRVRESVVPIANPSNGQPETNGNSQRHHSVTMEAIDRLQTQMDRSLRGLEEHGRELSGLHRAIQHLDTSMRSVYQEIELIKRELAGRSARPSAPPAGVDDRTLEVFTQNLTQVASKANEVDNLKMSLELVKRRVARLEDMNQAASPATTSGRFPMHEGPVPPVPAGQLPPSGPPVQIPRQPLPAPHQIMDTRVVSAPVAVGAQIPPKIHPSESSARTREADLQGGPSAWTTVNQNAKRSLPNGIDGRVDIAGAPLGSPKRPKLAPLEPRHSYDPSPHASHEHERGPPHLQQRDSTDSYPDSTVSQAQPYQSFPSTNQAEPDESWRPESQRVPLAHPSSTGTSPKRGGRGGGRGRPRKSAPHELEMVTPEWEHESWTGSQIGPDAYYHTITGPSTRGSRGNVLRRGSGGAPPHAVIRPGTTVMMPQQPGDPYAHTKKSRTKPIRNADGVLIRKDGRPDMRSQSSAANLRKVHARKEEERMKETGDGQHGAATSGLAHSVSADDARDRDSVSASPDTPDAGEAQGRDERSEDQIRHQNIMKSMFPRGIEDRKAAYGFPSSDDDREGESDRDTIHVKSVGSRHDSEAMDVRTRVEETQESPTGSTEKVPTSATTADKNDDTEMKDAEGAAETASAE